MQILEDDIVREPLAGAVIPGLAGIRKIRFAMKGKGKRGGGRAIYYIVWSEDMVMMLAAYDKSRQEDMSPDEKRMLRGLIAEIEK